MALATVFHRLDEICAAIPLGAAFSVGFKAPIGIEEYRPDAHEAALVEGKDQRV